MSVVRRLYFYGVAFASLVMLAVGLSGLGGVVVDALTTRSSWDGSAVSGLRPAVTQNAAYVLVGLPVWLLHWRLAERAAGRDAEERAAALRRLYLYAVLLAFALRWAWSAHDLLEAAGRSILLAEFGGAPRDLLRPLPWLIVAAALWAYHDRTVVVDRLLVGESGAAASLRRWYVYGLALGGLLLLLAGAAGALRQTWEAVVELLGGLAVRWGTPVVAGATASLLTGLALWLSHWSGWAVRADATVVGQDRRSVLLPVYLFLALGVSIGFALTAAARILYFALARLLGVAEPGGVGGPLLLALAGPGSVLIVYGLSWQYHRRTLAAQVIAQPELPPQAGVRRLYVYLVCLIALGLLATGAGGLLWTLADAATNASRTVNRPDWWREQVSLYATLVAVGLPVWLLHWGPVAGPGARRWSADEPQSLARRLYLYLSLLLGVLILLGSGAVAARQLLDLALGTTATGSVATNLARALAVAVVSGLVVFYHQRVLRADLQAVGASATGAGPRRPFGVLTRDESGESATWYATRDAARDAFERRRGAAGDDGAAWIALVRIEAESGPATPAAGAPPAAAAPEPAT